MNEPILTVNESILLLKADVKVLQQGQDRNYNNLKESQDVFHKEMKESFRDLKDDYSGRLNAVEIRTEGLEAWRNYIAGGLAVVTVLIGICAWVYISQQSIQDTRIDNLIKQINKI